MRKLKPVTPGELLREEFLVPMALSQYRLAKEIGVDIKGCDVLLVEDIVDTGLTLAYLQEILHARAPKSLKTAYPAAFVTASLAAGCFV